MGYYSALLKESAAANFQPSPPSAAQVCSGDENTPAAVKAKAKIKEPVLLFLILSHLPFRFFSSATPLSKFCHSCFILSSFLLQPYNEKLNNF